MQRGRFARLFSSTDPWDEAERERVRALNRAFYDTFVTKASEGRKRKKEEIEAVAQGRVWTGQEALAHGLVDRLGGLDAALALARERARLGPSAEVLVLPQRKGFLETLMERQDEDTLVRAGRAARGVAADAGASRSGDGRPDRAAAVRPDRPLTTARRLAAVALAQARGRVGLRGRERPAVDLLECLVHAAGAGHRAEEVVDAAPAALGDQVLDEDERTR